MQKEHLRYEAPEQRRSDGRRDTRPEAGQESDLVERLRTVYSPLYAPRDGAPAGKAPVLVADDRGAEDLGPDGRFKGPFTQVLVKPWGSRVVAVCMRGVVPLDDEVADWVAENGASLVTVGGSAIQINVSPGKVGTLRELASRVEAMAEPDRYAPFEGLKETIPRTAASLRRLADSLEDCWGGMGSGAVSPAPRRSGPTSPATRASEGPSRDAGQTPDSERGGRWSGGRGGGRAPR